MKRIQDPLSWRELKLVWEEEGRRKQTRTPKETCATLGDHSHIDNTSEACYLHEHLIEMLCPFYSLRYCALNPSLRYNRSKNISAVGFIWYKLYVFNQYFSRDL